jgi:hypothetical protein
MYLQKRHILFRYHNSPAILRKIILALLIVVGNCQATRTFVSGLHVVGNQIVVLILSYAYLGVFELE